MGFMALHYDFPYTASQLYCKTCKEVTTHNWTAAEYKCSVCGRTWDDELLRVSLKQDQYGKLYYECTRNSDKPVNSSAYPSTRFETLDACIEWFNNQAEALREEIK
jgi:DNA-directed RNA polymerase subunit RPC12/RpoP